MTADQVRTGAEVVLALSSLIGLFLARNIIIKINGNWKDVMKLIRDMKGLEK